MSILALLGAFVVGESVASPTPDGHPPVLPAQYTAIGGTAAAPYTVYMDSTAKKFAKYVPSAAGTTFTVLDCAQKLKYTNAGALPIPGLPPGACKTSLLTAFDFSCPSMYAPAWPPSAEDTYAGFRTKLNFKEKTRCPVLNASSCDHYVYQMYPKSKNPDYEVFDFYVNGDNQIDVSGTIKVGKVLYTHSLKGGVDQTFLQRPTSCPDPTGQCAICFTGPCGPCQQCLKVKTGACAKCWAPDAKTGFSCLAADGQSLCQKCYQPPAPGPAPAPPSPTPPSPSPSDTCATHPKCAALGLSGSCCPSKDATWMGCCNHSPACSANPACSALGIEGDCCPTKTGTNLECCAGSGPSPAPTPPAPTPPAAKCDVCQTGACAACKPCVSLKTGPCAPCWAKQTNGSACLPDCQDDGCWKTSSPAPTPPSPTLTLPAAKCDICQTGACAACKPCISLKTGPCAPCWAKQTNGSSCLPDCEACWKTATPAPTPPSPTLTLPSAKCDICQTGACAACKPCVSLKTGPCVPCWAKQTNGSSCLPDCEDAGCWKTTFFV